jgi:hypothetical protein
MSRPVGYAKEYILRGEALIIPQALTIHNSLIVLKDILGTVPAIFINSKN